jgi:hypothetical protein
MFLDIIALPQFVRVTTGGRHLPDKTSGFGQYSLKARLNASFGAGSQFASRVSPGHSCCMQIESELSELSLKRSRSPMA